MARIEGSHRSIRTAGARRRIHEVFDFEDDPLRVDGYLVVFRPAAAGRRRLRVKEAIVPFERQARAAGSTKYSTLKMIRFAWMAISSFSGLPLRLALSLGAVLTALGVLYIGYAIHEAFVHHVVPGWTSLVALQITFSGATLLAIGIVGDYIARIYEEIKGRPLYVLSNALNIDLRANTVERAVVLDQQGTRDEYWSMTAR